MIQIQTNIFGTFAIKNNRVIEKILFEDDAEKIAKKIILNRNNVIEEEISLINKINANEFKVKNKERFKNFKDKKFYELEISEILPINDIAEQIGKSPDEINEMLYRINLEITKEEMRNLERENLAIHYIKQIDELDKTINLMNEFLREIYGYHFPELEDVIKDSYFFAKIVSYGSRKEILKNLKDIELQENLKEKIKFYIENSFGTDFNENDLIGMKEYAKEIVNLYKTRKILDENLKILMNEIMPNVSYLVGHLIAARLLTYTGGLKKLAFIPASTIQMLGAEKAMFKFLRTKKNPPKHGIIFNVPEIFNSKKNSGRIARHLAAKISIASKVDYFKGEFIGEKLRKDFLNFVERTNKK